MSEKKEANEEQRQLYRDILEAHCLKATCEIVEACKKEGFEADAHSVIDSMIRWGASELIDTLKILPISVCGLLSEVISDISNETARRLLEQLEAAPDKSPFCYSCAACKRRKELAN
jgi:hypothetical protein